MIIAPALFAALSATPAMAQTSQSVPMVVSIEHDYRRCIFPLCGGYWISAVNRRSMTCADGTVASRCYVAELDWSTSVLDVSEIDDTVDAGLNGQALFLADQSFVTLSGFPTTQLNVMRALVEVPRVE